MSMQDRTESYSRKIESSSPALVQFCTLSKLRGKVISALIDCKEKTLYPAYEIIVGDEKNLWMNTSFPIDFYSSFSCNSTPQLQTCFLCLSYS